MKMEKVVIPHCPNYNYLLNERTSMGWEQVLALAFTGLYTIIASAGFWSFFSHRQKSKDAEVILLLGLTRAVYQQIADIYVAQGWIHREDYENLITNIYTPYKTLGGNSTADRIMQDLGELPLRSSSSFKNFNSEKNKIRRQNEAQDKGE